MNTLDIKLNNGNKIPQMGLGLWLNKDEQECKNSVQSALDVGYRHFDTAQIMIRWCIEQGFVVLPKSVHKDCIEENMNIFDFSLDLDDMTQLKTLDRNFRTAWDPTHVA